MVNPLVISELVVGSQRIKLFLFFSVIVQDGQKPDNRIYVYQVDFAMFPKSVEWAAVTAG